MKAHNLFVALAGLTIVGAAALIGCADDISGSEEPERGVQESDVASQFLACLTSAGVEAKINGSGQVLVKIPGRAIDDGVISDGMSAGPESGLLGMEGDDAGNTWVASESATYFADAPDIHEAYAACEEDHPDFTQAQFDPAEDSGFEDLMADQEEQALEFARCARENGFARIADPDFSRMNGVLLPADVTETEFRTLLETCWKPEYNFGFGSDGDLPFEPWVLLDEFQNPAAS